MMNMQNFEKSSTSNFTRRQFLKRATVAVGAATLSFPYVGRVLGANERINVACIGVGGKGDSDSSDASRCGGNIVALARQRDLPALRRGLIASYYAGLANFNEADHLIDAVPAAGAGIEPR